MAIHGKKVTVVQQSLVDCTGRGQSLSDLWLSTQLYSVAALAGTNSYCLLNRSTCVNTS